MTSKPPRNPKQKKSRKSSATRPASPHRQTAPAPPPAPVTDDDLTPLAFARVLVQRAANKIRMTDMYVLTQDCAIIEIRKTLRQRFRYSVRQVTRLLSVLRTPPVVQDAVQARRLPINKAVAVSQQTAEVQNKIARQIEAGAEPKQVVRDAIGNSPPPRVTTSYRRYVAILPKFAALLSDLSEMGYIPRDGELEALTQGNKMNTALIRKLKENKREYDKTMSQRQKALVEMARLPKQKRSFVVGVVGDTN